MNGRRINISHELRDGELFMNCVLSFEQALVPCTCLLLVNCVSISQRNLRGWVSRISAADVHGMVKSSYVLLTLWIQDGAESWSHFNAIIVVNG